MTQLLGAESVEGGKHLTGQHNQCPSCMLYFNSNAAFEKHRIGDFNKRPSERRCMTQEEMLTSGMALNARGWWVTALNPEWAAK